MNNSYSEGMSSNQQQKDADRDLLQLVAKAMGMTIDEGGVFPRTVGNAIVMTSWNPLENLEDAVVLAAKAGMTLSFGPESVSVSLGSFHGTADIRVNVVLATCRVIVETIVEATRRRDEARAKGIMQ